VQFTTALEIEIKGLTPAAPEENGEKKVFSSIGQSG